MSMKPKGERHVTVVEDRRVKEIVRDLALINRLAHPIDRLQAFYEIQNRAINYIADRDLNRKEVMERRRQKALVVNVAATKSRHENILAQVALIRAEYPSEKLSIDRLCKELNDRGVKPARAKEWKLDMLWRILKRYRV